MNEMDNELYEKLARLQWLRHKRHLRDHVAKGPLADPTRGQGRILAMLKMQDGISTKDLSYLLDILVSSLNELLAKMEKGGYITREPSESDKRVMLVKLTEKGRNEQQQESNPDDIFRCLSEDEKKTFADFIDRITAVMKADMGLEPGDDEHLGDEIMEHLASMRRGGFDPRGGFGPRGGLGGFSRRGPLRGNPKRGGNKDKD